MQLTIARTATSPQLAGPVHAVLDRYLLRDHSAPVAVALSGGGDSLALGLLAAEWAAGAGRRLLILTVDHGLQAESARWTESCRAIADRLSARFQHLRWEGAKPASGLPAAARAARHALLADAARSAGARVILMGHTGSDVVEAAAMRTAGATTPAPKEWAPSPAWPEGRGLFVLRPLLGCTRREIRLWLEARGETWIDDPANEAASSLRAGARSTTEGLAAPPVERFSPNPLALACEVDAAGVIRLGRDVLEAAAPDHLNVLLAVTAVCAGGGDRLPGRTQVQRLTAVLQGGEPFTAGLAGARLTADDRGLTVAREAGEARRGGLVVTDLSLGHPAVWDGRFEVVANAPGMRVQALQGLRQSLDPAARAGLSRIPAAARGALPAIVSGAQVRCPLLQPVPGVEIREIVSERLRAACGLVSREPL